MANENAKFDDNHRPTMTGVKDDGSGETIRALIDPATGRLLISAVVAGATGDVVGPASSTDNAIARYDSTTGKLLQNSVVTIADTTGNVAGLGTLNTHTLPGGTDTIVLLGATQTLTAKTLTSPSITTPTGLVKGDVGLGNVDNTADTAKPVSTAQQTALDLKSNLASPTFTGTVTIPTGASITAPTGLVKGDVGLGNVDNVADASQTSVGTVTAGNVDAVVSAASTTLAGKSELATTAETSTGTDTGRTVTPDGLAGSVFGEKSVSLQVLGGATATTVADGQAYITIPSSCNGMNLVGVAANVIVAGTTGTLDIQIRNVTQTADMLSTKMTIDSAELSTSTAATPPVIDTANDDVATGDVLAVDVDVIHTTPATGLVVNLIFRLP